jgi:hypothetical protein
MNKVYFFVVNEDEGGVYVAAKNWKEARKLSMTDPLISENMEEFIDLEGRLVKRGKGIIYTEYEGVLDITQIVELGCAWWSCENIECESDDIEIIEDKSLYEYGGYKCKKCGYTAKIPYVNI